MVSAQRQCSALLWIFADRPGVSWEGFQGEARGGRCSGPLPGKAFWVRFPHPPPQLSAAPPKTWPLSLRVVFPTGPLIGERKEHSQGTTCFLSTYLISSPHVLRAGILIRIYR